MEHGRFPNRLKKFRKLFCFSQKEVAAMLGLTDVTPLSKWEKGKMLPSMVHLFRLARIYKTMPNELYFDLWQSISEEISVKEKNLLALKESLNPKEIFYL